MAIIELYGTGEQPAETGQWWLNPFKLVDYEDLVTQRKGAYVFLLDLLVNRPTEFKVLIDCFLRAIAGMDLTAIDLTPRQLQAVGLAREAVVNGIHPTAYVASQLNITTRAVQRLLKRADVKTNMFAFGELVNVYDDTAQTIDWCPAKEQINAKRAALPRECAGNGTDGCLGHTRGRFALCLPCHKKYGSTHEEFAPETAKWLIPEINRIAREHRELAINELYREHHAETHERKQRFVRRAAA